MKWTPVLLMLVGVAVMACIPLTLHNIPALVSMSIAGPSVFLVGAATALRSDST